MQVIYRYSIIGSVFGLQIRKESVRFGLPMQILINNNMEYNKNGAIDRYYNLDNILKLNLDNNVRENIEKKFGKRVFFDSNDSCKIGKLCGLEVNHKLSMLYYIIETDDKKLYVPTYQSITLL